MALREELILDTKKARAEVKSLGADISKTFAQGFKAPTLKPIAAPKINQPVVPAPDFSAAKAQVNAFANELKQKVGSAAQATGQTIAAIGAIATGAAAVSVKAFTSYELTLSRIIGLTNLGRTNTERFSKEILKLAVSTGKSPKELAEGLYFVASAGIAANNSMSVLTLAAKAAAAGLGETDVVARAIGGAMNAYGQANLSAAKATDILVQAVNEGAAEAPDFAQELGAVLPIANAVGVSLDQVAAATAALTNRGLSAAESTTALRQVLATILAPTKQGEDALKTLGLSAKGLREELREKGLLATLTTFAEKAKDNSGATTDFFGNIRALTGFLAFTGTQLEATAGIFDRVKNSTGATDKAFKAFKATSQATFDTLKAGASVALIQFGSRLAPAIQAFGTIAREELDSVGKSLQKLPQFFNEKSLTTKLRTLRTELEGLEPILAVVGLLMVRSFAAPIPIIGQFLGTINPVVAVLGALLVSTNQGRTAIASMAQSFSQFSQQVLPGLLVALHSVVTVLSSGLAVAAQGLAVVFRFLGQNASITVPAIIALASAIVALKVASQFQKIFTGLAIAIQEARVASAAAGGGFSGLTSILAGGLNPIVLAVTAAVTIAGFAFGRWAQAQAEARRRVDELTDALGNQDQSIRATLEATVQKRIEDKHQADDLRRLKVSQDEFTDAVTGSAEAAENIRKKMIDTGEVQLILGDQVLKSGGAFRKLREEFIKTGQTGTANIAHNKGIATSLAQLTTETRKASKAEIDRLLTTGQITASQRTMAIQNNTLADGTVNWTAALTGLRDKLDEIRSSEDIAKQSAEGLKSSLDRLFNPQATLFESAIAFKNAIDEVTLSLKESKGSFDISSEAGRRAALSFSSGAGAALDYASAQIDAGTSAKEATTALNAHVNELVNEARAAGASEEAVNKLREQLGLTPKEVTTKINLLVQEEKLRKYLDDLKLTDTQVNTIISLQTEPAKLESYLNKLGLTPKQITTILDVVNGVANRKLDETGKKADAVGKKKPTITPAAITERANRNLTVTGNRADSLNRKKPKIKVTADTSSANLSFDNLLSRIRQGLHVVFGLFGGGKALGGPVAPNTPYVVGEKGPELFIPKNAGMIIPNNRLKDAASHPNTSQISNTRTTNIIVNAREARIDERKLAEINRRAEILQGVA